MFPEPMMPLGEWIPGIVMFSIGGPRAIAQHERAVKCVSVLLHVNQTPLYVLTAVGVPSYVQPVHGP
jgi:hypothetical protein